MSTDEITAMKNAATATKKSLIKQLDAAKKELKKLQLNQDLNAAKIKKYEKIISNISQTIKK